MVSAKKRAKSSGAVDSPQVLDTAEGAEESGSDRQGAELRVLDQLDGVLQLPRDPLLLAFPVLAGC